MTYPHSNKSDVTRNTGVEQSTVPQWSVQFPTAYIEEHIQENAFKRSEELLSNTHWLILPQHSMENTITCADKLLVGKEWDK